ncbi:MAG: MFS family permease [Candidatus Paceibacteria bacterium]|jgi:MFS family permease
MKFPESNTPKLLVIATLQGLTFYAAFEKIFFQENGLSIIQIALLTVVFSLTMITLEVPSGALSDRWIRKYVLSLSILASIVTLLLFVTGDSFLQFAIGMFFAALAFVLNSGTNTSILFDSLKEFDATEKFEKYLALRRILSGAGFAIASLIGGWTANQYGISMAIWITLGALVPALLLCLNLREPVFHKTTGELSYFGHIGHTAKHLTSSRYFINVIVLSVMIMSTHILIEDYSQLYYFAVGFSLLSIGIISFFEGLKEMVANYLGAMTSQLKNLPLMYGCLLVVMAGALLFSAWQQNILGVAGLFIASAMFFIIDVPLLGAFHKQLDSSIRATSESFMNLVTELSKMLLAIGFAWIANLYGVPFGFGALGILMCVYIVYYWLFAYRTFAENK